MTRKILAFSGLVIIIVFSLVDTARVLTAQAEEGASLWQKLSSGQVKCQGISEGQFESLGEFFMGRMVGSSHELMDQQLEQMMGEEGLRQMHLAMGKRMSGCDSDASFPVSMGMMMNMMGGGGQTMIGSGMMNWNQGWGMMGQGGFWIWSILSWLTWVLVIIALIALIRWLWKKGNK